MTKKFELGQVVITNGVAKIANSDYVCNQLRECLFRHCTGDWGNLCEEDKQVNDDAVINEERILSAYELRCDDIYKVTIWIITEWDRSVTTILLPEEY